MSNNHLNHSLKMRHILMIAIGSAIGTGLFFGAGESIKLAGPSILLAYLIGGMIMYIVIRALGEMTVAEPNVGSFSFYAYKYIGNYAGFMSGWNYWFNYIIVCMLELTATGMFLDYWMPGIPHWLTALIILLVFGTINLLQVKFFGEFEFWFAGIKVITILALIIFGVYVIFFDKSNHASSFSNINNLWKYGGFFANGLQGFLFSFVIVVFSFGGTELVGIAAGESSNPKKVVPMAINGIIFRIIIFYVATLAIIMCLYPWNKIGSDVSPFVDVFQKIGIVRAANIMNLVAITAALSSFNSGIYGTARMIYNLGKQNNAPFFLTRLNKNGVPQNATLLSLLVIFITVILNYLYPTKIFNILLAVATIAAIINWVFILITHIAFRRESSGKYTSCRNTPTSPSHVVNNSNQEQKMDKIRYKLPFYPLTSIIAIVFFIIILIVMSQMDNMHLAIYIAPIWLVILSIGFLLKHIKRNAS
ncbi:MAG: amino acid permease [Proteobacteria bacterium]|jgi:L-asparagine transporter-like permease|nr:amino acid permease [Pseudomonadota bacterium]